MRRKFRLLSAVLWLLPSVAVSAQEQQQDKPVSFIEGVWATESKSEVTIAPCEARFCGNLSKIVVPENQYEDNRDAIDAMAPEDFKDYYNKDPELRERLLLGLPLLTLPTQLTPVKFEGEIYNPQDGNTYFGKLEVLDINTLRLTGCGFFNLICQSEVWVRVDEPEDDETAE